MPAFTTTGPISATVDIIFGNIRFAASDRDNAVVTVSPVDPAWELDVRAAEEARVEFSDGKLTVRHPRMRNLWTSRYGTVEVLVELPAGSDVRGDTAKGDYAVEGPVGSCQLKTPTGHIRVERAASVHLRTTGGTMTVGEVAGRADISGNGTIQVSRLGGNAVVKNIGGETRIGEAYGDLRVNSANGPVTVDVARAALKVRTGTGDLRLGQLGAGPADLYTPAGEVEIGVPRGSALALDARTTAGRVRNFAETAGTGTRTVSVRARTHGGDIVVRPA
ncbi:DUF4097 family beta strand repeat-containing protein [Longispora albida]|uniref:DUF4097 family beta strand repeat-containing protein n=1 Tax=Longispora albida TaxID=203523 RepID=UPI00036B8BB5|nr:DUF4097 family beta strand repeat-containing protein [Longispora albida]